MPTNDIVTLTIGEYSLKVNINDEVPREKGILLDMSVEVAEKFGITSEGFYNCFVTDDGGKMSQSQLDLYLYYIPFFTIYILLYLR